MSNNAKKPNRRLAHTNEIKRWALGDSTENFNDVSLLNVEEEEEEDTMETYYLRKTPNQQDQNDNAANNANNNNNNNNEANNNNNGENAKKSEKSSVFRNDTMSRLVPGALQKNITTERRYVKEVLQLSQQRYVHMNTLEFQKKAFMNKQAIKGIFPADKGPQTSMSMLQNSSENILTTISEIPTPVSRNRSESIGEIKVPPELLRRRSSTKLNLELARIHSIELKELSEKVQQEALKKAKRQVELVEDESKIIQEISEKNHPAPVSPTPKEPIKEQVNEIVKEPSKQEIVMPQIKTKVLRISEESITIQQPKLLRSKTFANRLSPVDDGRYQALLVSMTSVYKPPPSKFGNESPNDRILRVLRSNTAFIRENCQLAMLNENRRNPRHTYEDNYKLFEKRLSTII